MGGLRIYGKELREGGWTMSELYVVLVVSLLSWAGIFFYLLRLDSRIKELERR